MFFDGDVDRRIEQGMSGTDKRCHWFPGHVDQILVKRDAFIIGQDRLTAADAPVAVTNLRRYVLDLVSFWFAFVNGAAKEPERFKEKRGDVVWLQTAGVCSFHLFANLANAANVHHIAGQSTALNQFAQMVSIERFVHDRRQSGAGLPGCRRNGSPPEGVRAGTILEITCPRTSKTCPPSALRSSSSFFSKQR